MTNSNGNWRIMVDGKLSAARNMAIDEALFRLCTSGHSDAFPTIRFYQWENPTLSFGSSQKVERAVDVEACGKMGFDVVRRPTGGRAVLHDDEVTYSVIAPAGEIFGNTIQETYRTVSEGLLEGFKILGVYAQTEGDSGAKKQDKLTYLPCFSSSTKYELAYEGKKFVGSAQRRNNLAFVQHGSIILDFDSGELLRAIGADEDSEDPGKYMIGISRILGRKVTFDETVDALRKGIEKKFAIELKDEPLTQIEDDVVQYLQEAKYEKKDWNFCR